MHHLHRLSFVGKQMGSPKKAIAVDCKSKRRRGRPRSDVDDYRLVSEEFLEEMRSAGGLQRSLVQKCELYRRAAAKTSKTQTLYRAIVALERARFVRLGSHALDRVRVHLARRLQIPAESLDARLERLESHQERIKKASEAFIRRTVGRITVHPPAGFDPRAVCAECGRGNSVEVPLHPHMGLTRSALRRDEAVWEFSGRYACGIHQEVVNDSYLL